MTLAPVFNAVLIVFSCFTVTRTFLSESNDELIIELPNGKIQGHVLRTLNNNTYYAFQEIPFGSPPVGDLRFKEPTPPKNWPGILQTTKNTKICPQGKDDEDSKENEDCLYLNVFTPSLLSKNVTFLPVMFYIYGGMFRAGDPTFDQYDFQLFPEAEVVVVTSNFRSGPLGFLSTEDGVIPDNIALKDQQFALKWVQRNIHLFGGDPSKVTIVGHSSGGACVGFHLLKQKSEGLFRAVIIQSGSSIVYTSFQKYPRYFAYELGKKLSTDFTDKNSSTQLLKLLKQYPASIIMRTHLEMPSRDNISVFGFEKSLIWRPTAEDAHASGSFVHEPLHDNLRDGKFNKVPILIGITSEEASDIPHASTYASAYDSNILNIVHNDLNIKEENKLAYAAELKSMYTEAPFLQNMTALYKFTGDLFFNIPVIQQAVLASKYTDVYFYQFSYDGPRGGRTVLLKEGLEKVGHTEELPYLYFYRIKPEDTIKGPPGDNQTSNRLIKLWTNFIKHLNPTPVEDPLLQNVQWPKATPTNFIYLDIDTNLTVHNKYPKKYLEWVRLMNKYYEHPLSTCC